MLVLIKSIGYIKNQKHKPAKAPERIDAWIGASDVFCPGFKNFLIINSYPVKYKVDPTHSLNTVGTRPVKRPLTP